MTTSQRVSLYDRIRPHLDAHDLIDRLGIEIVREIGPEAYCRPLCHESQSGESLHVNLHTGRWTCRACQAGGVYGDLFQLVEYAQTGGRAPTHGSGQGESEDHRGAVQWLCEQFAIPYHEDDVSHDPALGVVHLFSMEAHRHLLENSEMLAWVEERWGFDLDTVKQYGIGFMPSPLLPAIATEAAQVGSKQAFRSSGIGWYGKDGTFRTHFAGRVLFPYLEHGRSVYLIGRATPQTPALADGRTPPKYHKLTVHSERRPHVSPRVTNDHLYNERVMAAGGTVVIAEGVADAVALSSLGVPVVSPVTISFNATDLERFTRKAHESHIDAVEILFDNELSGSGNSGALRTAIKLVERGLRVRIITLPLGPTQSAARREVAQAMEEERFAEFEDSDPPRRKEMLSEIADGNEATLAWLREQVAVSKIDAAEWVALCGPAAAAKFDAVRKAGADAIVTIAEKAAESLDVDGTPRERLEVFRSVAKLVARLDDRLDRATYAGVIAKLAGKGVTKTDVAQRIASERRAIVKPKAEQEREAKAQEKRDRKKEAVRGLRVPPPIDAITKTAPSPPPGKHAGKVTIAKPEREQSEVEKYAGTRSTVLKCVEEKVSTEQMGEFIAQTIVQSMGFTAFKTPESLFLVRGSERVEVGLSQSQRDFATIAWRASGLTPASTTHRSYLTVAIIFLAQGARRVEDVSWSFVDEEKGVFFPQGDASGRLLHITPDGVKRTHMAEAKVPAVAGVEFRPFEYVDADGGVKQTYDAFRWTSLAPDERMILVYWLVCLPMLRRIGTIPILRIEGGSGSGKTRTVDAVSWLVNGRDCSSVPTAAALASRLSREMLTIDDNRESTDVNQAMLGTLLQATQLGARSKRKLNSDTGTVIERVSGALLMNGIEPIHNGKSELASRMLTIRCGREHMAVDSPRSEDELRNSLTACRNGFWSESVRRCSAAMQMDRLHGARFSSEIETAFGATRIGRMSVYLRAMVFAWIAGHDEDERDALLEAGLPPLWRSTFEKLSSSAMSSLVAEELAVIAVDYAFSFARGVAEMPYTSASEYVAVGGKYRRDVMRGDEALGEIGARQLARLAREAGKQLNAPWAVTHALRAGQLEQRILDGLEFLDAAGYLVESRQAVSGRWRFSFYRPADETGPPPPEDSSEQ